MQPMAKKKGGRSLDHPQFKIEPQQFQDLMEKTDFTP